MKKNLKKLISAMLTAVMILTATPVIGQLNFMAFAVEGEQVEAIMTSIAVKPGSVKTDYFVGDKLDISGLTLVATYDDESSKEITEGFTCDYNGEAFETAGKKTINVSYDSLNTSFDVNVSKVTVEKLSIYQNEAKKSYFVGDKVDTTGLTLKAVYNNGKEAFVNEGFTVSPETIEATGKTEITVTFGEKTVTYSVTAKEAVFTGIALDVSKAKTLYYAGEKLDTSGVKVYEVYGNGLKIPTTGKPSFDYPALDEDVAGSFNVKVSLGGFEASYRVKYLSVRPVSIAIEKAPDVTEYTAGDTIRMDGIIIKVINNNGSTEVVDSDYKYSPLAVDKAGETTVTVTYKEMTASFKVNVKASEVESVKILTNPKKTAYHVNNTVSTSGLVVQATYTGGKVVKMSDGFRVDAPDMSTAGTKTVKINVGGKSASYKITVANHKFSTTWSKNGTYHWHQCSCGEKADMTKHTAGDWTVTKNATYFSAGTKAKKCEYCGQVLETASIAKRVLKAPTDIKVTAASTTSLKVTYSKAADAKGYVVYNKTTGKVYTTTATTYTITGLKVGTKYDVYVRSYIKGGGLTSYSPWSAVNHVATKPASTTVTLKAGTKQFTASWKKVAGVTGYQVTYATNSKFTSSTSVLSSTTSKAVTGLKAGTYYVKVRAYIKIGSSVFWGAYSPAKTVKVK